MSKRALQQLGPYTVHEEIGRGGMAIVYRATHPLYGEVALKVLHQAHDVEMIKRFMREIRVMEQLQHAHLVTIYDYVGKAADPQTLATDQVPFLAMEYLDGGSLDDRLRQAAPLSIAQTLNIAQQIGSALEYAHQRNVIHRDIKPSNILFRASGEAVLVDFGIAQAQHTSRLTRTGSVAGTIPYMPPEVAHGQEVVPQSDVYALSLVLYECLTGSNPFAQHDLNPLATMKRIAEQPLPPLQLKNGSVNQAIATVIHQACHKQVAVRPASMAAFLKLLQDATHQGSRLPPSAPGVSPPSGLRPIALTPHKPVSIARQPRRTRQPGFNPRIAQYGAAGLGLAVMLWFLIGLLVSDPAEGQFTGSLQPTSISSSTPVAEATPVSSTIEPRIGATATLPIGVPTTTPPPPSTEVTVLPAAVEQQPVVPAAPAPQPTAVPAPPPAPVAPTQPPPPPDTDNDGFPDQQDGCPTVSGSVNGCPPPPTAPPIADRDGDGVPDDGDFCPDTPQGSPGRGGCPDADGDSIVDKDDACPNEPGIADRAGCPVLDSDGDGLADHQDACPYDGGSINGCPDSDGDGIADIHDGCPGIGGPNNGCPRPAPRISDPQARKGDM